MKIFFSYAPLGCGGEGTAERESKFQEMKRAAARASGGTGSFLAFHGSRPEHWHGILQEGLKNMSREFVDIFLFVCWRWIVGAGAVIGAGASGGAVSVPVKPNLKILKSV